MNIIILIIASDDKPEYVLMQKLWKSYMNTHPNIKSFFIKMKPDLNTNIILDEDNNTIWSKGKESLIPGVLDKTIKSIKYLLENRQVFNFDFIFRTNLSSVVNLNLLYEMVLKNYINIDYAGLIGCYRNINFASGAGFLMSVKICDLLVSKQSYLNYKIIDDVSIGELLGIKNKIKICPLTRFDAYNYELEYINLNNIRNYYHFRCKSDLSHCNTIKFMEKIIDLIYNIKLNMKLTTVLASVNNNPDYYLFIPKQIHFWKKFNINFLAVYVGKSIPKELNIYKDNIILWDKNTDLNSTFVAQNIRIYYPALLNLPDDELVMITDMDMLPMSGSYYKDGLEKFNKDDFIYYRNIDGNQVYMCYNAAHPHTWAKVFDINSEEDVEKRLDTTYNKSYNGRPGSIGWFTDQEILYKYLIKYPKFNVLNKPIKRLSPNDFAKLINQSSNFISKYDDCHFHRSFSKNIKLLENAELQLEHIYKDDK